MDRQTRTHRPTTVTLAAHARRGLMIGLYVYMSIIVHVLTEKLHKIILLQMFDPDDMLERRRHVRGYALYF